MNKVYVLGGGVSGLATAYRFKKLCPEAEVSLIEASSRFGGKIISHSEDGFLCEGAADGFLIQKPPMQGWLRELGLENELIETDEVNRVNYIFHNGLNYPMPKGFVGMVPKDLGPLGASKLVDEALLARVRSEAEIGPGAHAIDESVRDFFVRRYGREFFELFMAPFVRGVFAGDPAHLSAEACFGQLRHYEKEHGSLSAGLKFREASPGQAFKSLGFGVETLTKSLVKHCEKSGVGLLGGQRIVDISLSRGKYALRTQENMYEADAVISALQPNALGQVLQGLSKELGDLYRTWPMTSVSNIHFGFKNRLVSDLVPGTGFVTTEATKSKINAVTLTQQKWPGRVQNGQAFRLFFGGANEYNPLSYSNDEIVAEGLRFLEQVFGVADIKPDLIRVFRWPNAFAQLEIGHVAKVQKIKRLLPKGFFVAGGYLSGVGIPDCLLQADIAAQECKNHLLKGED